MGLIFEEVLEIMFSSIKEVLTVALEYDISLYLAHKHNTQPRIIKPGVSG